MARIALVDDDRNILTSVAMTLEAEGFEVETYNDGQSALDAFNRRLPDMAVLDIKMPRMDGMDLLQRLRQKTTTPVIFLTSKDDEIDEVLGLRMGADDYVKKPFSQRLLVERRDPAAQPLLAEGGVVCRRYGHVRVRYVKGRRGDALVVIRVVAANVFISQPRQPGYPPAYPAMWQGGAAGDAGGGRRGPPNFSRSRDCTR